MRFGARAQLSLFQITVRSPLFELIRSAVSRVALFRDIQSASFLNRLRTELLGFRNLATGEPIFVDTILSSDVYPRSDIDGMPDLMLKWNRRSPINSVVSDRCGQFHKLIPAYEPVTIRLRVVHGSVERRTPLIEFRTKS